MPGWPVLCKKADSRSQIDGEVAISRYSIAVLFGIGGQRAHRGQEVAHLAFRNAAGDEHEPARAILAGPGRELDRRMGEVLDHVHHNRPAAARDVEQAFHAQEVGTA
jgi:hypothetical protein